MRLRFVWLFPLLLVTEGHPSGSVSTLAFEQIVRRSDAVLLVRKGSPQTIQKTVKAGKKRGQTFTFTYYRFQVDSVVHSRLEGVRVPKILDVEAASDRANFEQTQNHYAGRPTKILIYPVYQPSISRVDTLPEFLIFIRFDRARKRFVFVARDAYESREQVERLQSALSHDPPRVPP